MSAMGDAKDTAKEVWLNVDHLKVVVERIRAYLEAGRPAAAWAELECNIAQHLPALWARLERDVNAATDAHGEE